MGRPGLPDKATDKPIDFPDAERAAEIVRRSVPAANAALISSATAFIGRARALHLDKAPGMAETIDWVSALSTLGATELVRADAVRTIGTIAKTPDDRATIAAEMESAELEIGRSG